jgi:hypothetical protein
MYAVKLIFNLCDQLSKRIVTTWNSAKDMIKNVNKLTLVFVGQKGEWAGNIRGTNGELIYLSGWSRVQVIEMASILVVYFQFFRLQMATWKQKLCVSSGEEIFPAHSPFWPTNTRVSLFTFLIMSFAEFHVGEKVQPSPINEPMLTNHNSILAGLFSFVVQNPRAFVVFPT